MAFPNLGHPTLGTGWLHEELEEAKITRLIEDRNSEIGGRLRTLVKKYIDRFEQEPPTPEIWRELYTIAWDEVCASSKRNSLSNTP